jgi:DNA topoisomerase-1
VLGPHPKDKRPVELHAGRYGPYVKHGAVNATLPDKDSMDALTLADAVALLDAKSGKSPGKSTGKPASAGRTAKPPKAANGEAIANVTTAKKVSRTAKSAKEKVAKATTPTKLAPVARKPKAVVRKRTT